MKLITFTNCTIGRHNKAAVDVERIKAVFEYEPFETTIIFGCGEEDYVRVHEPFDTVMQKIMEASGNV